MPEAAGAWAFCGQPLDGHDLNFRLRFPDVVAEALDAGFDVEELGGDPEHDTVIGIEDTWFLRVLLGVRPTDGGRVTFGTWLEVTPDALDRVAEAWSTPPTGTSSCRGGSRTRSLRGVGRCSGPTRRPPCSGWSTRQASLRRTIPRSSV